MGFSPSKVPAETEDSTGGLKVKYDVNVETATFPIDVYFMLSSDDKLTCEISEVISNKFDTGSYFYFIRRVDLVAYEKKIAGSISVELIEPFVRLTWQYKDKDTDKDKDKKLGGPILTKYSNLNLLINMHGEEGHTQIEKSILTTDMSNSQQLITLLRYLLHMWNKSELSKQESKKYYKKLVTLKNCEMLRHIIDMIPPGENDNTFEIILKTLIGAIKMTAIIEDTSKFRAIINEKAVSEIKRYIHKNSPDNPCITRTSKIMTAATFIIAVVYLSFERPSSFKRDSSAVVV